jgi:hypothetical protein
MDRLLNVTAGMSIILIVMVLISVRRAHIRVEYSITWLVSCVVILILSRFRPLLDAIRNAVGLPDSPLALFLLGSAGVLVMLYRFSVMISHLRDDNIALAQRVAILEYHIKSLAADEKR